MGVDGIMVASIVLGKGVYALKIFELKGMGWGMSVNEKILVVFLDVFIFFLY